MRATTCHFLHGEVLFLPQVPARAAAAAVVARALAKLPPHQKNIFSTNSEYLISIYNSSPHEQSTTEELEENFYEKVHLSFAIFL